VEHCIVKIALDTPLDLTFDYRWCLDTTGPYAGQLVVVPFGRREVVGIIVEVGGESDLPPEKLKQVIAVRAQLGVLSSAWLALCAFAGDYYQRPLGEVALPGLPKNLRVLTTVALDRALKKLGKMALAHDATPADPESGAADCCRRHRHSQGLCAEPAVWFDRQRQDRGVSAGCGANPGA
jgi:primosomal protein N' (replication factor Y)